jgi:hypothetical protein
LGSGQLPDRLILDSAGLLSGTPTKLGSFTFTVVASNTAGRVESDPYTVTVASLPAFTSTTPPGGWVGVPYSFPVTASSSPAPSFAVASGTLPAPRVDRRPRR